MADIEKMKDFFDARAGIYEAHMFKNVEGIRELYRTCAACIEKKPGLRLLDLGCGTGLELEAVFMAAPDMRVTGIDLSVNMLDLLKEKFRDRTGQIELVTGSYLELDFGREAYDYALSVMSLHHLEKEDKTGVYRKVYATLKPGGAYIEADYTVPTAAEESRFSREYLRIKEEERMESVPYHIDIPFTPDTQTALLKAAGFTDVSILWRGQYATVFQAKKTKGI
jgi:tRNA (cmo5U34)-methyltransferase